MWLSALWLLFLIVLFAKGYKKQALILFLISVVASVLYFQLYIIKPWPAATGCLHVFSL